MRVKTVAVNRNGTKVLINESDFVEGKDQLWTDSAAEPHAEAAKPQTEKEALLAELAKHGIEKDKRTSVANLRKALAEVE